MTSPATPATPPGHSGAPTTLEALTPEDVLAAVPVVLGFEPSDSVVMLTFGGNENFHARVDVPPPREIDLAVDLLLEPAVRHEVTRVVFVVYADDGPVPRGLVSRLRRAFRKAGIDVVETLRVHDGRWFSPGRPGATPRGVPFDIGDHRFRAQAVFEGIVVHTSRAELERQLAGRPEEAAAVSRLLHTARPSPPDEIADLVGLRLGAGRFADIELVRVLRGLLEPAGRDAASAALTRDTANAHVRLWTDAVQRAPDDLVAAPAAVLALAAWLAGHGALAWCAVDRAQTADPDSVLAGLVAELLAGAVPPSSWSQVA